MFVVCLCDYLLNHNHSAGKKDIKIGIVGPCSAGKSTLIKGLATYGFLARHIAQEHSYVPDMWKRLVDPDVLVYLDVSYQVSILRRPINLTQNDFDEQNQRLAQARKEANFYLHTDLLSIADVLESVLTFLRKNS